MPDAPFVRRKVSVAGAERAALHLERRQDVDEDEPEEEHRAEPHRLTLLMGLDEEFLDHEIEQRCGTEVAFQSLYFIKIEAV